MHVHSVSYLRLWVTKGTNSLYVAKWKMWQRSTTWNKLSAGKLKWNVSLTPHKRVEVPRKSQILVKTNKSAFKQSLFSFFFLQHCFSEMGSVKLEPITIPFFLIYIPSRVKKGFASDKLCKSQCSCHLKMGEWKSCWKMRCWNSRWGQGHSKLCKIA